MRITFIAYGTRGDLQPALVLAGRLKKAGHAVRILAGRNFRAWIEGHGVEAVPAMVDVQELMNSSLGREWSEHGNNQFRQMRVLAQLIEKNAPATMREAWEACQDAQIVVSSFTSDIYATSIAEKLNAAHVSMPLQPTITPTRSGAALMITPVPDRESVINYWIGQMFSFSIWSFQSKLVNTFRRSVLGLASQNFAQYQAAMRRATILQAFSAHVVPHPPDWPDSIHTTGYWFLDEDTQWQPPAALQAFLQAGERPLYVGFGSMTGARPDVFARMIADATAKVGARVVLQAGWAGMGANGAQALPEHVFVLDSAPHHKLFPLMRAVVHHGGAGTTAEGLRGGVPTLIVPHLADQPFWGERVARLGVGPRPITRPKLTVENLAAALRQILHDEPMRTRAEALGAKIRAEDGIGTAFSILQRGKIL